MALPVWGCVIAKRREDLWFRFYSDDWLDKTREMALGQRGRLIDAIVLQMTSEEPLRDDYEWLANKKYISVRLDSAGSDPFRHSCERRRSRGPNRGS